ncbi:hypothetical protein OG579_15735 [Williamsia herbipolensis]|uniref:DUF385 domain-containing protein n=1 Tax=Williamsia herbipolensis TaxID=1603258 RepID=A0AAU4JZE1_9NOCA|nr:hypothetical protein [Williamsia herbipolensis]
MNTFQKSAAVWNSFFTRLMRVPLLDKVIGKSTAIITYTGRKSGKTISLPVSFSRSGETLTVRVMMPDKKNWWRNFTGTGDRVTVDIAGVERAGHAVTSRSDSGAVSVRIDLESSAR